MSSTNKTANYELSQFVGTDIPSILNDYNGDMRKIDSAIHNASVAGGDNATAIAELQTASARMNTEISGINSTVNTLSGKVLGVESVIPATASAQNKLLTAQELPEIPSIAELEEEVSDISDDVKAIQLCVPANASSSNKLATMADVGDSPITQQDWDEAVDAIKTTQFHRARQIAEITSGTLLEKLNSALTSAREIFTNMHEDALSLLTFYINGLPFKICDYSIGGWQFNCLKGNGHGFYYYDLRMSTNSAGSVIQSIQLFENDVNVYTPASSSRTELESATYDSYGVVLTAESSNYAPWYND